MRKNFRILCFVSLMALVLVGCGSKAQQKREITVVGSTALQPMVEMAAEEYQKDNHDVSITVQGRVRNGAFTSSGRSGFDWEFGYFCRSAARNQGQRLG